MREEDLLPYSSSSFWRSPPPSAIHSHSPRPFPTAIRFKSEQAQFIVDSAKRVVFRSSESDLPSPRPSNHQTPCSAMTMFSDSIWTWDLNSLENYVCNTPKLRSLLRLFLNAWRVEVKFAVLLLCVLTSRIPSWTCHLLLRPSTLWSDFDTNPTVDPSGITLLSSGVKSTRFCWEGGIARLDNGSRFESSRLWATHWPYCWLMIWVRDRKGRD